MHEREESSLAQVERGTHRAGTKLSSSEDVALDASHTQCQQAWSAHSTLLHFHLERAHAKGGYDSNKALTLIKSF